MAIDDQVLTVRKRRVRELMGAVVQKLKNFESAELFNIPVISLAMCPQEKA